MNMRLPTVKVRNDKTGEVIKLNRDDWMEAMANGAYHNYSLVSDQTRVNRDEQLVVKTKSTMLQAPLHNPKVGIKMADSVEPIFVDNIINPPPLEEKKQFPDFNIGSMDHQQIVAAASEYFDVALDANKHLLTLRKEFGELLK